MALCFPNLTALGAVKNVWPKGFRCYRTSAKAFDVERALERHTALFPMANGHSRDVARVCEVLARAKVLNSWREQ